MSATTPTGLLAMRTYTCLHCTLRSTCGECSAERRLSWPPFAAPSQPQGTCPPSGSCNGCAICDLCRLAGMDRVSAAAEQAAQENCNITHFGCKSGNCGHQFLQLCKRGYFCLHIICCGAGILKLRSDLIYIVQIFSSGDQHIRSRRFRRKNLREPNRLLG